MNSISIAPQTIAIVLGFFIPLIVGLVTKSDASPKVKVVVNIALSGVAALITNSITDAGVAVISFEMLSNAMLQVAISITTYLGVYKPLDVSAKLLPTKGIG